jgi:hypothetical protein
LERKSLIFSPGVIKSDILKILTRKEYSGMKLHLSIFVPVFLILTLSAPARGDIELLASQGSMEFEIWAAPSPVPGFCYWTLPADAGPAYHATNADGNGNSDCVDPWLAHCDTDSLVYHGTWPALEGPFLLGTDFRALLSCTVVLDEPKRLAADRVISGDLEVDEHIVIFQSGGGDPVVLLGAPTEPDQAALDLPSGTYNVDIVVEASAGGPIGTPITAYDGRVRVIWEDSQVPAATTSWSKVKALYR